MASMRHLRHGCALLALALAAPALHAQETTGTIRGNVTDDAGGAIANATVTVTHVPSGTRTTLTTDADGGFNATNLRLGGPFSVTVAAPNFDTATANIQNVAAGQAQRIDVFLVPAGQTIAVTANRQRSVITLATGPATSLTREEIEGVASVNRDIRDLARRDPLVNLDPTNSRAISIAGQNNRFNRITVDGVLFGDPFGLNNGGLASARGPIPLDAICEFTVEVAPADITQGNFQGGAVNTQLCAGNNSFGVQGFYTYSADELAGDRTRPTPGNPTGIVARNFTQKSFGGQVTGPIIRDKLFFAVTYEGTRNSTPTLVGPAGEAFASTIAALPRSTVDQIRNISQSVYQYDPLNVATAVPERDDKLVAKVDWNIADGHRASATFGYNKGDILAGQSTQATLATNNPTLALQSNNYRQGDTNYFGVVQLNNEWSDSFSTQLRVSYQDYERLQVPYAGRTFGQFTVCTDNPALGATSPFVGSLTQCSQNSPQVTLGPDVSRQTNTLNSTLFNVDFQANIKGNGHSVKIIAERRAQDINNNFQQNTSGAFYFDTIAALQARQASSLTLNVPVNGDPDSGAAIFDGVNYAFGVQDTWDVTDDLTFVYGFRWDLYDSTETPQSNSIFLSRYGFANTSTLKGRQLFQPRFGLNWRVTDRLRVSGSAGIIGGGNPNVWISNSYANPGTTFTQATITRTATGFTIAGTALDPVIGAAALNNVGGGAAVPASVIEAIRGRGASPLSTTNALDPNFEVPSQWRFAGKIDYAADLGPLGDEWNFGADAIYSKVRNSTTWTDLRSRPSAVQATLPDGRPRYLALTNPGDTNTDVLLFNNKRGYSLNLVGRLYKAFENGFDLSAAYTWQRVRDVNSGTSSVALSNYGQTVSIDPNQSAYGISNYQIDNTLKLGVGFRREFFKDAQTRVDLFFESRSGQRFSYTFQDQGSTGSARSPVFGTTGVNNRYLMYVPTGPSDPNVVFAATTNAAGVVTQSAADAAALFDQIVSSTALNDYRGQIAPKNIGRSPRFNKLDLHVSQEVPFFFGSKFELFGDIENVLNLIDKDWGSLRQVSFPYFGTVANVACQQANGTAVTSSNQPCARYVYSNVRNPALTSDNISLWAIRVGARFRF